MDGYVVHGGMGLARGSSVRIDDGAGILVYVWEGELWITEENQPRDIVLKAGACYRLRERGVALVNSLGGFAAVSLA